jgi:hypothetical protein
MSLYFFLVTGHIIATVLGVGGATMIEIHLNKALRDGKMDTVERDMLGADFLITRIGMVLGLITGIGFIVEYWMQGLQFNFENGIFWAKMLIFLIIVINAYLLHKHWIGLYWGSAFSFISWWTVMLLGIATSNGVTLLSDEPLYAFLGILALYALTLIIGAQVLHQFRERMKTPPPPIA